MKKLLIITCILSLFSCHKLNKGIIIEKTKYDFWYSYDYDPNLKMVIMNYHPDEYYLIVRGIYHRQQVIETFDVTQTTWLKYNSGDSITFN